MQKLVKTGYGKLLGKLSKKNDETYGIFHMLVDPPPYQHMENSFVIFFIV